jgi:glycosyltransferase involved in cell wall biosynthesis
LVAEVVFAFPGDLATPTGGYRYDRRVIDELRALRWDVRPLSLPADFPDPSEASLAEAERLLAATPSDAVLLIDGLAYGALPVALIDRLDRRIVALVHHALGLETGLSPQRAAALLASEKAALSRAAGVVANSPSTAEFLFGEFGVAKDKITVAEPGVDPAPRAGGSEGQPVLLSVGAVTPRKGFDTLVAALKKIADLPWECRIAGRLDVDPAAAGSLRAAIAKLGLDRRVKLLGALDDPALAQEYDRARLFVLPSHFEGYGMAYTEALARGLPVVAGNGGATAHTVPTDAGVLVPPGDADALAVVLRRLLADSAELGRRADAAWRHAERLPRWRGTAVAIAAALEAARP